MFLWCLEVRAAECIMNHATKAIEVEDIEARVCELERARPARMASALACDLVWDRSSRSAC